jgi:hypothetical protein
MPKAAQIKKELTSKATKIIENKVAPQLHFLNMVDEVISLTETVTWSARDIAESIAEDTPRNTSGNANKFSKSTGLAISGAEFHETISMNQIFTSIIGFGDDETISSRKYEAFLNEIDRQSTLIIDKFTRRNELTCNQIMNTGVVQYKHAGSFDFDRPATSMVDLGAPAYWSIADAPIKDQLSAVPVYFRTVAGYHGKEFDMTISTEALMLFERTNYYLGETLKKNVVDIERLRPMSISNNATYMYTLKVGSAYFHVWVSDGKAKGAQGGPGLESYMPTNKVVFTPVNFKVAELTYFPVDAVVGSDIKYLLNKQTVWDAVDQDRSTMTKHIKSRTNVIMYYNKMVYTLQVLA